MNIKLSTDSAGIQKAMATIESRLTNYGLKKKDTAKALLLSEELISSLLSHGASDAGMRLRIQRFLGDITVEISIPGQAYDFTQSMEFGVPLDAGEIGQDAETTIRNIILRSYADDIKYRHSSGVNSVRLTVQRTPHKRVYYTLGAMLLAIVLGIFMRLFCPETIYLFIHGNLLSPVRTMFMNGLKMVVAPVVFFSIVSCISQFGDLSSLGKIGAKILGLYLTTTLIATMLGVGMDHLFQAGSSVSAQMLAESDSYAVQDVSVSLLDTVINIIPNNFVKPFLESNMLQLIFLAVVCGIAVGMIGKYSRILTEFFEACHELFLKITTLLIKFMPLVAFCSILSMILTTGTKTLMTVLGIHLILLLSLGLMMMIYCIILALSGLSPARLFKKYAPTMLQVFSLSSSNASLPLNMRACQNLGISPKVYSLSLPLGATMNMDGICVFLGLFSLSLARVYGVEISGAAMLSIMFSIIVLSIGAPGIPGSGLICLSVLLTQLGVPIEAVGLIVGLDPLMGMFRAVSNCTGDVIITAVVAKSEGLMDREIYQQIH